MKKSNLKIIALLIVVLPIVFISCDDEDDVTKVPPTIQLLEQDGYITTDSTFRTGDTVKVMIDAASNSSSNLVNFIAAKNGTTYIDDGLNQADYQREVAFVKDGNETEDWEFSIRDLAGSEASVSITINLDTTSRYGDIVRIEDIKLGAQDNTGFGSFYSIGKKAVYTLEEAYNDQTNVDLTFFYDDFAKDSKATMASPGANVPDGVFSGDYILDNWTTLNTVYYSRSRLSITEDEFYQAVNDSILIATTFAAEDGGRKAKKLAVGDMYAFIANNKAAIFKVKEVVSGYDGYVIFDMIIQKEEE